MKYPFQQLSTTNARYAEALKRAAAEVIDSGWYLNGPQTEAFEHELSARLGTDYSIATGNGLDALKLIMRGYIELGRLRRGDVLIAPANTFIATILPADELGLETVLLDPEETTMNLDPRKAEEWICDAQKPGGKLDGKKGILAVTHLYGSPSWDTEAAEAIRRMGVIIIEDNAQAIGARWHGLPTGSLGDASAISFYPAKNIGALGDAGAVSTSDRELADVVQSLRNYGGSRQYHYDYRGYNTRMDELQAAFLRIKLADLEGVTTRRRATAEAYTAAIDHPEIILPPVDTASHQVWHQYVIRCRRRDELAEYLRQHGVGTLIHYPVPPHRQRCYNGAFPTPLPTADRLGEEVLSLPIADATPADAREIAAIINTFPTKNGIEED